MATKEETSTKIVEEKVEDIATTVTPPSEQEDIQQKRSEKLLEAKELYTHGSRNFLIKSYNEAADELSRVCALYAELHGELSDELGMPYLLYAKSLIALAVDEQKVLDVPDEEADDDEDDGDDDEEEDANMKENGKENAADVEKQEKEKEKVNGAMEVDTEIVTSNLNGNTSKSTANGNHKEENNKNGEADSTDDNEKVASSDKLKPIAEDAQVSSTHDDKLEVKEKEVIKEKKIEENGTTASSSSSKSGNEAVVLDDEKPSTSNGETNTANGENDEEDTEAATNLQLAWEILEMAAKIFTRQGSNGLPNLAEVQTELANIQFENNILDAAREDYRKALLIYKELASNSYRRAMAEIHYKIGLTYLMQQLNKDGAASLKEACLLINDEIEDIKSKPEVTEKDKNNIQDMEETKQEIEDKILEIEEMQSQQLADVRKALDSYIKPIISKSADGAGPSSSSVAFTSTSTSSVSPKTNVPKASDISHLIKRKKPEEPSSEAEASPAKRPAV